MYFLVLSCGERLTLSGILTKSLQLSHGPRWSLLRVYMLKDDNQTSQSVSHNRICLAFLEKEDEALNVNKLLGEIRRVLVQARLTLKLQEGASSLSTD